MKLFVYLCQDIPDSEKAAAIRRERLADHLRYVELHLDSYAVAGPNRHPDGSYHSSTFIVRARSLPAANALMAADPYVIAGLYPAIEGVEFVPAAGNWVGGLSWK